SEMKIRKSSIVDLLQRLDHFDNHTVLLTLSGYVLFGGDDDEHVERRLSRVIFSRGDDYSLKRTPRQLFFTTDSMAARAFASRLESVLVVMRRLLPSSATPRRRLSPVRARAIYSFGAPSPRSRRAHPAG